MEYVDFRGFSTIYSVFSFHSKCSHRKFHFHDHLYCLKMPKSKREKVCCNPFISHRNVLKANLRAISAYLVEEAKASNIKLKEKDWICDACRAQITRSFVAQKNRVTVCCNPFSDHGNNFKKGIRKVNSTDLVETAKKLKITITGGQYICNKCRSKLSHLGKSTDVQAVDTKMETGQSSEDSTPPENDPSFEYIDKNDVVIALDNLLKSLNMSSVDKEKLRNKYYQSNVFDELKSKLSNVIFTKASDYASEMIEQMKKKFVDIEEKSEKLKLLSVLPKSWSADKIQSEFLHSKPI